MIIQKVEPVNTGGPARLPGGPIASPTAPTKPAPFSSGRISPPGATIRSVPVEMDDGQVKILSVEYS